MNDHKARSIAGLAALVEMFSLIGKEGATDSDVAKVLTENELALRALAESFHETLSL